MTALLPLLKSEIETQGPMTIARYMELALGHAGHGYYMTRDPLGLDGDFITSPEISQMFGEMLGLWVAMVWQGLGAPDPVNVVELGPGRGTLAADAMRAAQAMENFDDAARLWLVETSSVLRAAQKKNLMQMMKMPAWRDTFDGVGDGPLIVLGNEFFDALPIRQYVRGEEDWHERLVGLTDGKLAFVMSDDVADGSIIPETLRDSAKVGDVFEDQSASCNLMQEIAARIVKFGGAALFFDYGHDQHGVGETLQAVKSHQFADVLKDPGEQDLTAHVDFEQLAGAARKAGAEVLGPVPQGAFLNRLGMRQRADMLMINATPDQMEEVDTAFERLTGPEQMGVLFKVIAVVPPGFGVPPWSE